MFSYLALLYQCIAEAYKSLQDEALLASWKHQLDRDSETLKMKGNLNHLRTVSIFSTYILEHQALLSLLILSLKSLDI